ncbi:hypothetical protein AV530_007730 [Patagioenas fasciata monilis]|uniref:Uncharacterized protein n=1 Tax=Patagioenas fasciata monilis TaxID=372326 RepID=A0A1V4JZ26_PATFA|nr:hypothetical protein AV530_007730 [Patagioenas fasciata monilis]
MAIILILADQPDEYWVFDFLQLCQHFCSVESSLSLTPSQEEAVHIFWGRWAHILREDGTHEIKIPYEI